MKWEASILMDSLLSHLVAPQVFHTAERHPLLMRRVESGDAALIVDLLYRLSAQTRWLRYFTTRPFTNETAWVETERIVRGQAGKSLALIATAPNAAFDEVIAVAELVIEARNPKSATLAIVVRDDYQRQGIGQTLANQLVRYARKSGLSTLRADLLAENRAIRRLLDRLGVPYTTVTRYGEITATLNLSGKVDVRPTPG